MNKNEIIGTIFLIYFTISSCFLVLKVKGKEALKRLIIKAEFIFDWKGAGQEKLKYVLNNAQKNVPIPFKWFLKPEIINRLVEQMKNDLIEAKEIKSANK